MTVPYQFANATGNINLSELDANFDSLGVFSTNAATVTANAQPNVTSVGTLVSLTATGNIRSVNGYLFGDGRFITNLPAANGTYGNANVASYLPTYTGSLSPNSINSTNITTTNLSVTNTGTFARSVTIGQGLQVTNDINSYGNVVGKNFVSATGNANVVNVNANSVSTANLTATGLVNVATLVPGTITGNGNIFANFITANANLAVSGRITTNGVVIANQGFSTNQNLQANNVTASSAVATATLTASGNITGGNILAGAYFYANGQPFTGSGGGGTNYSNANVASFLAVNTGPINGGNLSVALVNSNGNVTGANVTASGNVTAAGIVATNYQANANVHIGGTLTAVGATQVGSLATNGNINAGNVIATSFVGSGTQLTGISGPAFMATITSGQGLTTSPSGVTERSLVFNTVSQNINNGYSNSTGVFTAPVAGFYQVSAACAVTTASWSQVLNYYSSGVIGVYKNNIAVSAGPFIDFRGLILPGNIITAYITASSISSLIYLNVGDTLQCKLAYITNAPTNFWNTYANLVPNYFQACWLRS